MQVEPIQEGIMNPHDAVHPEGQGGTERHGKGHDGTIPEGRGVGLGASDEPNTFEPEEDPDATEEAVED